MAKYKNKIHILNVMPGAVVTENTEYLGNTMFNVSAEQFVKNVVKQIGTYQGNSIYKEYKDKKYNDKINILNVMPGAVVTENTEYLGGTMFNVTAEKFVKNVIRQIGNYEGNSYGYWGHEFSILLVNIFPFIKDKTLYNVGLNISKDFMTKPNKKY